MKRKIEVGNIYRLNTPQETSYGGNTKYYIRINSKKGDHFYGVDWIGYDLFWPGKSSNLTREAVIDIIFTSKYVGRLKPRYKRIFSKQIRE